MKLPKWYREYKSFIEEAIESYLEKQLKKDVSNEGLEIFKEAILYSTKGGKKIRSILALELYLILGMKKFKDIKKDDDILKLCVAIELVHAYSLVHDDLPCMDNDVLRRGQATVWKKYGEANGVLVGDMLNSLAFEALSEIKDSVIAIKLVNLLGKSVGFHGMLGGQVDDIYFEKNPEKNNISHLVKLHNKKTGALIKASIQGGILVSGKVKYLHKLSGFGEKLGLAFQIKDDIMDVEGSVEDTGKSVGGEDKGFVHLLGVKESKARLNELLDDCLISAKLLKSEHLRFIVSYIGSRVS